MESNRREKAELILFVLAASVYFFALTYRAFGYYFDMHDIHNLSWSHIQSPLEFLIDTFNPLTNATIHTYRPAGALFYNLCYKFFGINFAQFHFVNSLLHLINATIIFILIRDFTKNTFAAFLGGILFTFHSSSIPAYWKFSCIFDVLCGTLMFLAFLLYVKTKKMLRFSFFLSLIFFFFACRTKEMAFALPFILLFYELCLNNRWNIKKFVPFFVIAVLLGLPKIIAGVLTAKGHAYALDLQALGSNILFYWNTTILSSEQSSAGWMVALLGAAVALLSRNRLLQFGYACFYAALAPVLLLAAHRYDFFLYIPLFGICVYIAELFRSAEASLKAPQVTRIYLYALLIICFAAFTLQNLKIIQKQEAIYVREATQIKEFIQLMKPLQPKNDSMLLFDSGPDDFDVIVFTSAAHLLYHDWTIAAKIVDDCENDFGPSQRPEVYCISYQKRKVYRIKL
jgi:hypothetical protein